MRAESFQGFALLMLFYTVWDVYWMYNGRGFAKYWWIDVAANICWALSALYSSLNEVEEPIEVKRFEERPTGERTGARASVKTS